MKWMTLAALLTLAACTDPSLNIGASINSGGVSLTPSLSGRVGDVGVAISP